MSHEEFMKFLAGLLDAIGSRELDDEYWTEMPVREA
jgi:hypothetical protein